MNALNARITRLEVDNANLSQAASQASSLVESLASENDQLHAQLKKQAREHVDLAAIADEMEAILRSTVAALQHRLTQLLNTTSTPSSSSSASSPAATGAPALLAALVAIARVGTHVADAPLPLSHASVPPLLVCAITVDALSCHADHAALGAALRAARHVAARALIFAFEDAARLVGRTGALHDAMALLRDRLVDVVPAGAPSLHDPDVVAMKRSLIHLAVDAVDALLPPANDAVAAAADRGAVEMALASPVLRVLRASAVPAEAGRDGVDGANRDEDTARLRSLLGRRETEIDELRVRATAFENELTAMLRQKSDADGLRARAEELELDNRRLRQQPAKSVAEGGVRAIAEQRDTAAMADAPAGVRSVEGDAPVRDSDDDADLLVRDARPSPVEMRDLQMGLRRLRTHYLHGAIADLQICKTHETSHSARGAIPEQQQQPLQRGNACDDKDTHLSANSPYDAMTSALQTARRAAANARVVQLDKHTLRPATRGATLSHRALHEAIIAARSYQTKQPRTSEHTEGGQSGAVRRAVPSPHKEGVSPLPRRVVR